MKINVIVERLRIGILLYQWHTLMEAEGELRVSRHSFLFSLSLSFSILASFFLYSSADKQKRVIAHRSKRTKDSRVFKVYGQSGIQSIWELSSTAFNRMPGVPVYTVLKAPR